MKIEERERGPHEQQSGRKNSKRHERLKLTQHVHILKLSSLQTRIYNDSQKCV